MLDPLRDIKTTLAGVRRLSMFWLPRTEKTSSGAGLDSQRRFVSATGIHLCACAAFGTWNYIIPLRSVIINLLPSI